MDGNDFLQFIVLLIIKNENEKRKAWTSQMK